MADMESARYNFETPDNSDDDYMPDKGAAMTGSQLPLKGYTTTRSELAVGGGSSVRPFVVDYVVGKVN